MMPGSTYRIDASYREEATLANGTRVLLRLVQPGDRELLRRGFGQLSDTSRYLRFFATKTELTEAELTQLTELDGVHQLALGALAEGPDGMEGLGIARFARDPATPAIAEAAVTVTDTAQGSGLGTLLLARLAEAARERGIAWFRGEFLAENERVRAMIAEACPDARLVARGESILVEVPLAGASGPAPGSRLLGHVAGGRLALRLRHLLLKGS